MRWNRMITVVGTHAGGDVVNVVTGGVFDVPGETMFDKRRYLQRHADGLRKFLTLEPRGSVVTCADLLLPSNNPKADLGYIVMEPTEYPPLAGSSTIGVATVILETGILPMKEPVTEFVLEAPAGLVAVRCTCRHGKVTEVKFRNVPAFALFLDAMLEVPGVGTVRADIAYGGMTYALVQAKDLGFEIVPDEARDICVIGERIKAAATEQFECVHPENPEIRGVTVTEFTGPVRRRGKRLRSRNTVVCAPGRIDRSPCGSGTSARLAVMHAKGEIAVGEVLDHESINGTHFIGEVVAAVRRRRKPALITTVAGRAWITAIMQYGLDPDDPFPEGHTLPDTWPGAP